MHHDDMQQGMLVHNKLVARLTHSIVCLCKSGMGGSVIRISSKASEHSIDSRTGRCAFYALLLAGQPAAGYCDQFCADHLCLYQNPNTYPDDVDRTLARGPVLWDFAAALSKNLTPARSLSLRDIRLPTTGLYVLAEVTYKFRSAPVLQATYAVCL